MAPSPVDYPVLISQLPFVSKLATAEQTHPEVRQELFGPLILQKLREQGKEQVPEVNPKEAASTVTRDGGGNAPGGQSGDQKRQAAAEEPDDEETSPSSGSPWTGNIINKKI